MAASPVRAPLEPSPVPVPQLVGGIQVNEPDHGAWARAVADAGLDAVQVTLYARQQAWDGPEMYWDSASPSVVSEIRAARAAGLRTVLVMRVALEHGLPENRHLWHGMIWPRAEHLGAWSERYRAFVLGGARMAAAEGVDLFVVGNELNSMTSTAPTAALPDLYAYWLDPGRVAGVRRALVACADEVEQRAGAVLAHLDGGRYPDLATMLRAEERVRRHWVTTIMGGDPGDLSELSTRRRAHEAFWRDLVADVREIYSGPVSYGANFDQYMSVGFWDVLDALSVTGYFPLSRYGVSAAERRARMRESWAEAARGLGAAAGPLPVVLLELGWTRRRGSTVRPWSYDRVEVLETGAGPTPDRLSCVHWASQPLDPVERGDALEALADVVAAGGFPAFRGLMLWKLTTRAEHRAIEPFAIVLDGDTPADSEDRRLLSQAARIADMLRGRMAILGREPRSPVSSNPALPYP